MEIEVFMMLIAILLGNRDYYFSVDGCRCDSCNDAVVTVIEERLRDMSSKDFQ